MSADNMFGPDEQAAFGSTPDSFEIFVYSVTPAVADGSGGSFASSPELVAGTFLAAIGGEEDKFSTPFATAGLVTGGSSSSGPGGGPGDGVLLGPEPSSMVLLGTALLAVAMASARRLARKRA